MRAALVMAALLLAGLVGLELRATAPPAPRPVAPLRSSPALPSRGGMAAERNVAAAQAIILARPLFSPDRRPPAGSAATPAARTGLPRLAGVLIDPSGRRAIFADGPRQSVVTEGGAVGEWRVAAIEAGQVTLRGPDGTLRLHPAFAATPTEPPARAPAPPAPTSPTLMQPK